MKKLSKFKIKPGHPKNRGEQEVQTYLLFEEVLVNYIAMAELRDVYRARLKAILHK